MSTSRSAELVAATPGIFDAVGVPIVNGRPLGDQDVAGSAPVCRHRDGNRRTV